jgi:predicted unusual protein kinase regulating ubiquinone biosynthesis (AarF/ABC1/UbiB family)
LTRAAKLAGAVAAAAALVTAVAVRWKNRSPGSRLRVERGMAALRLAARGGARYATNAPRLFASAGEHRQQLRNDLALQTAEDVAATLGTMKGVLMKLGQMASYVDDGLTPAARRTLSRLQDSVPPMSPELAAQVITEELGQPPEQAFATWDPEPIAAASIGQVHRAITHDGRAVAVKVQYPGIAETIEADLGNVALLRRMLKVTAPAQDVDALIAELRERVVEELDYRREARNQQLFVDYFDGHPTIHVPRIVPELSTRRVVTSELADGARFAELASWSQAERDLAAETIYRFVFRSLYELHAFNGDPHPGNYLFHRDGHVTFLDFGLVKHFTAEEMAPLEAMVKHLCVDDDPEGFRQAMVRAGFLLPDAPVSTPLVVEHMAVFYDTVRERGPRTMTSDYATTVTRRFFDFRSPLASYARIPRSYVILQRINLGLFALLGELSATADWRCIAEEIWPFFQGPPCTPMGAAEAGWRAQRAVGTHSGSLGPGPRPVPGVAGRGYRPGPAPQRDRGGRGRYAPNQPGTSRRNAWPAAMARRSDSRADIRSGPSTPAHRERMSSKIIADVASASRPRGVM